MNFIQIKSTNLLKITIITSFILVISIYFMYRAYSWPFGFEATGCLISLILLAITAIFLWLMKNKIFLGNQGKNVSLGLYFGLLWTIEIMINNIIRPGLPLRDHIDDIFFAVLALLILITASRDAYKTRKFISGLTAGFWSGLASGAIACLIALSFIVFGMKLILLDPLNIKEWSDVKMTIKTPGMDVYFAYQTLAGAIMHLFILGALLGLLLGAIGGILGRILSILKSKKYFGKVS